jgi:hypothetical protein
MMRLREGATSAENTPTAEMTPEQRLKQEVDNMGAQLLVDMAKPNKTAEEQAAVNKQLKDFKDKWGESQLLNAGFTKEQAEAAMKAAQAAEGLDKKNGNEAKVDAELQKMLQELRAIEVRMMMLPETQKALEKKEEKLKRSIRKPPPPRINESSITVTMRQENLMKMQELSRTRVQLESSKNEELLLQSQYVDTLQKVRSKLGMSGLGEWIQAKLTVMYAQGMRLNSEQFVSMDRLTDAA